MRDDPGTEADALNDMMEDDFTPTIRILRGRSAIKTVVEIRPYDRNAALMRYELAKSAKTGATVACAACEKQFKKASHQQAFCCNKGVNNCKDVFWNRAKPERTERAKNFVDRRNHW